MKDIAREPEDFRHVRKGDRFWATGAQQCFGGAVGSRWYLVHGPHHPRQMAATCKRLAGDGALTAWFPKERRHVDQGAKRRRVDIALTPGLIFMNADRLPQWHVLKARWQVRPFCIRRWQGSKLVESLPVTLGEGQIADMRDCPQELVALQEALVAARLAQMPRVGDRVCLCDGVLAGFSGAVEALADGVLVIDINGLSVRAARQNVEKVD